MTNMDSRRLSHTTWVRGQLNQFTLTNEMTFPRKETHLNASFATPSSACARPCGLAVAATTHGEGPAAARPGQ